MFVKRLCKYCGKNVACGKGFYCSVCYRNKLKKKAICKRCQKLRATITGLCLSCYNQIRGYGKHLYRRKFILEGGEPKICSNKDCVIAKNNIKIPLQLLDVDHIDNNKNNSDFNNLQFLCVWCHAIKTRSRFIPLEYK